VKALLKAGAEVIVLAKTEESLKAFKEEVLITIKAYWTLRIYKLSFLSILYVKHHFVLYLHICKV